MLEYSKIRSSLDLEDMVGDADYLAYATHYLQNHESSFGLVCKEAASEYFYKTDKKTKSEANVFWQEIFPIKWDVPFPSPAAPEFTFIDLFAGIGGFRIALQGLGGKCIFSSEYNRHAQRSYELNFGEVPFGDITKLDLSMVPEHDVLCAGFPCQPFSISGKMKGFEDTRGTLIYSVFEIIKARKPKVVFLENVKHLVYHDGKRTLQTIVKHLGELGYNVSCKVLNASSFGLPQNRERILIIGHTSKEFDFSKVKESPRPSLKNFLDDSGDFEYLDEPYTILENIRKQESGLAFVGYRNKKIRKAGVRPGTEHLSRVHKQPNRIYSTEGIHPALPSQEVSGRFWIYDGRDVRKLTINECYRIMGFPKKFRLIESRSELYKQVGNSVAIPMIREVGKEIKKQFLGLGV